MDYLLWLTFLALFSLSTGKQMGCYYHPSTHCVVGTAWTVRKQRYFKYLIIRNTTNAQHRNSSNQKLHSYNCNIFIQSYVSLKVLGLKLVKLDFIIIYLILIQLKKLEMSWMEPVTCLFLYNKTNLYSERNRTFVQNVYFQETLT